MFPIVTIIIPMVIIMIIFVVPQISHSNLLLSNLEGEKNKLGNLVSMMSGETTRMQEKLQEVLPEVSRLEERLQEVKCWGNLAVQTLISKMYNRGTFSIFTFEFPLPALKMIGCHCQLALA